jgi:hypothetical protein
MSDNTKFCVSMDGRILDMAKKAAIERGVQMSIASKTGPFIRYLLEEYLTQDSPAKKK